MELQLQCIENEMDRFRSTFERVLRTRVPLADNVIRYFLDRRGKQLRPILTILSAKMLRGEVTEETIFGAVAVELLHNASLMHDDVVDDSPERRGAATINRVWDNRVAVLTGDFFLAKCLMCSNAAGSMAISRILGEMVTSLVEGELEQLSNARSHLLSEDAYFSVIRGKTASLFAACLRIGAHSVGASEDEVKKMGEIGERIGLVFQIRDDIFDYFPSNDSVGKPTGHDIMEGKVTLPLLYALQQAPAEQSKRIKEILLSNKEMTETEVSQLVDFAKQMGGIEYAQARMKNIAFEAKQLLNSFPTTDCLKAFVQIVDYFIDRNY
jgi:octaprenyl-diphosphate synthase